MLGKPFSLAVRAVILDEQGRCLLLRRSNVCRHFVGQWEWPGGKVDDGETLDIALPREIREETGLEIEPKNVIGAYGIEMERIRIAVLCFEAGVLGGELRLSEEHDNYSWVPLADLPKWDITAGLKEFADSDAAKKQGENKNG